MAEKTVQVLVATMHQTDHSLINKMHLKSDVIVANQCDSCSNEKIEENGHEVIYINRPEIGVGNNRNNALMYASGDILTFADDDMVFCDNYVQIITKAFDELPKADGIIFNIITDGIDMGRRINLKAKRIHFYNALNYGAARLSVKSTSVKRENITFHTCFGGGAIYSAGEDSLFITDMLKRGLKLYTYPVYIAKVDQTSSSWFDGYNEKYFFDKGVWYKACFGKNAILFCLLDLIRHQNFSPNINLFIAVKCMINGIKGYKTLKTFIYNDNYK